MAHRVEKVSAQLQRELSQLINMDFGEIYGLITVSDIAITADFKDAKVFISIFDESKEEDILKGLGAKAKQYQHILGRKMKMKFTPKLTFKIDNSQDKINRVDELLKEVDHGT